MYTEDLLKKIQIYADTSDINLMLKFYSEKSVSGFTTNPSLMRKSEVTNYERFARTVLENISDMPVSFEVFSVEFDEMEKQALKISSWGENVFVKIPVMNTQKKFSGGLIKSLSAQKIKLNITAVFTEAQAENIIACIDENSEIIISVFAGRIADAGVDPVSVLYKIVPLAKSKPNIKILWASARELFNVIQSVNTGCHIITLPPELLTKIHLLGKDLDDFSLDTVKMFYNDAFKSGYKI